MAFRVIARDDADYDRIAALCGQPVVSRALLSLEARGLVTALAGQRYVKRM